MFLSVEFYNVDLIILCINHKLNEVVDDKAVFLLSDPSPDDDETLQKMFDSVRF